MLLSLDDEKAFDKVWQFLMATLEHRQFGHQFCKFLQYLQTDTQTKLTVNKLKSPQIDLFRGTCQGCPLSPILFNLSLDPLFYHRHPIMAYPPSPLHPTPAIPDCLCGPHPTSTKPLYYSCSYTTGPAGERSPLRVHYKPRYIRRPYCSRTHPSHTGCYISLSAGALHISYN